MVTGVWGKSSRRRPGGNALLGAALLLLLAACEEQDGAPAFDAPLDLLPGSAHTTWIWEAPFPEDAPFFLLPPVPPRLRFAKEGALSLVRVRNRGGSADAPIGGFDFGGKQANEEVLAELQGQVYRDLRFGMVSDLILLRGQLKADDVGGPGLSRQAWFVKTELGLKLLLPAQDKGNLRLLLDPRRAPLVTRWTQRIPRRFGSLLGFRSFLSLGLGSPGAGKLLAYAPLVREPEGLPARLRSIPRALADRFQKSKASWLLLGLDLPAFLEEAQAGLSTSNDPMQGGAMDFLMGRLATVLGPFADPRVRASLGDFVAFATMEELGRKMPRDPSRLLFVLGLKDAKAFEAALTPFADQSGRGARVFRLRQKGEGAWVLSLLGFRFDLGIHQGMALLSSSRTRDLAALVLGEEGEPSAKELETPSAPWREILLRGRLHLRDGRKYRLELGRVGSGLGASIIEAKKR